jgi:predicted small secreted protein
MPANKKLTIAAVLAVSVSVAGCNSKKAIGTDSGNAATTAAAGPAASAADSGASAPAAAATGAAAAASGGCPLTAAQVTTVMGATYGAPQNTNGFCFYAGQDSLSIHVEDVSGLHTFDTEIASAKESQQTDKPPTTIPGLGDKAAGVGQQLVVAAGGKTIDIRDADTGGTAWPNSIALAKLVIAGFH